MLSGLPFVFLSCCFTQPILRLDVRFIKECRLPVREVRQKSCHTGNGCLSSLCCPFIFIDMNSNYYDCMKIIMQARHNVSGFDCCCQRGLWHFFCFPSFFSKEGCNGSDVREAKKKNTSTFLSM